MKTFAMAAGVVLMAFGLIASSAAVSLRWGWLYIPSVVPAMLGWQLYKWGRQ